MAPCVADEVGQNTAEAGGVDLHRSQLGVDVRSEGDPGGLGGGAVRLQGVVDEHREVDGLAPKPQRAGLGEPQGGEVVDEDLETAHRVEDRRHPLRVRGVDAVGDRLRLAADDRERGAQLVIHLGDDRAPALLGLLEPARHRVEGAGEAAQLGGSAHRDPHAEITRLDPSRGLHQPVGGGGEPAPGGDRGEHREQAEEERRDRHQAREGPRGDDPERARHQPDRGGSGDPEHGEEEGEGAAGAAHHPPRPGVVTPGSVPRRPALALGPPGRPARPRHQPGSATR